MEKDSNKYLRWKLSKLQEKYQKEREFWSQDCIKNSQNVQILKNRVQDLQEELAVTKDRESDLKKQLKIIAVNSENHGLDRAALEESIEVKDKKSKAIQARLQWQLVNNKEHYEKTLIIVLGTEVHIVFQQ